MIGRSTKLNYGDDLKRLAQFDINFYCLRKDGVYAGGALWGGQRKSKFAVNDNGKSRLEDCVSLYDRK